MKRTSIPAEDAINLTRELLEATSLGGSIVTEILRYVVALRELSAVSHLEEKQLRERCKVIHDLARMSVRFAEDMENLLDCNLEAVTKELEALKAGGAA